MREGVRARACRKKPDFQFRPGAPSEAHGLIFSEAMMSLFRDSAPVHPRSEPGAEGASEELSAAMVRLIRDSAPVHPHDQTWNKTGNKSLQAIDVTTPVASCCKQSM